MKTPATITRLGQRLKPVPPPEDGDPAPGPLWKRLLWFAGLCLAGSITVATVAYGLRVLPFGA